VTWRRSLAAQDVLIAEIGEQSAILSAKTCPCPLPSHIGWDWELTVRGGRSSVGSLLSDRDSNPNTLNSGLDR
jgi:hypothetical protein